MMNDDNDKKNEIRVEAVQNLTPHNKALYEAGKKMLIDSVDIGREFCKFMTTTTLGAIPIYVALIKFVIPQDYVFKQTDLWLFISPFAFLVASILFVLGYFPQKGSLALDLPDEIEKERSKTIERRQKYALWGFIIFCLGILTGSWILINKLQNN